MYLYYLSLEKCMSGEIVCSQKIDWIQKKIAQSILSSIILGILIELIILELITKLHFIHFFLFLIIIYNYSNGEAFYDHGLYNFLGCIIIIIATLFFLIPFNILLYLKKNNKNKLKYMYIFILLTYFMWLYNYFIYYQKINYRIFGM